MRFYTYDIMQMKKINVLDTSETLENTLNNDEYDFDELEEILNNLEETDYSLSKKEIEALTHQRLITYVSKKGEELLIVLEDDIDWENGIDWDNLQQKIIKLKANSTDTEIENGIIKNDYNEEVLKQSLNPETDQTTQ